MDQGHYLTSYALSDGCLVAMLLTKAPHKTGVPDLPCRVPRPKGSFRINSTCAWLSRRTGKGNVAASHPTLCNSKKARQLAYIHQIRVYQCSLRIDREVLGLSLSVRRSSRYFVVAPLSCGTISTAELALAYLITFLCYSSNPAS